MSYNSNMAYRNLQGPGRRMKHVGDPNAINATAPLPNSMPFVPAPQPAGNATALNADVNAYGAGNDAYFPQQQPQQPQMQQNYGYAPMQAPLQPQHQQPIYPGAPNQPQYQPNQPPPAGGQFSQFGMLGQPMVQDMALQYGQRLADQGKQLVENQFEKYVPVGKLKYYFAVDNAYVGRKLRLLFFPYMHKDWSVKYDQEHPVQPRYDINAPDLYIPTMGYITYVIVAGLLLGLQNRFSPEQLGIQASSALAYSIFELIIYLVTMYVVSISSGIKTLDLLAFAGYKFVNIVFCLLASALFYKTGYYVALLYTSLAFGFFLIRTLRTKVLQDNTSTAETGSLHYDPYGSNHYDHSAGRKRKLYLLFFIVGGQALLTFLLTKHLYLAAPAA